MPRPPLPPFTSETAAQKARLAEDAWNSRDPSRVSWVRQSKTFTQPNDYDVAQSYFECHGR